MEKIVWVVTPPCRRCDAPPEFMRRFSCIGCEKFHRKKAPPVNLRRNLTKAQRQSRNTHVIALRDTGLSLGQIAEILNIPRATAQSAEAAARRKGGT